MDASKVIALTPAYSHINHRLGLALARAGIRTQPAYEGSDLPRVRSELLTWALEKTDAEAFILVDSDIVPTVEDIAELVGSQKLSPNDAVSAAYPTRDGTKIACRPLNHETVAFQLGQHDHVELEGAGLGFMIVHRQSLERLAVSLPQLGVASDIASGKGWRPFCVPFYEGTDYYPDDYSLCARLRRTGTRLWLRTDILPGHIIAEPRVLRAGRFAGPSAPPPPAPEVTPPVASRGKRAARKSTRAKRRR